MKRKIITSVVVLLSGMMLLLCAAIVLGQPSNDYVSLVKAGTKINNSALRSFQGSAEISFWRTRSGEELDASRKLQVVWDGTRLRVSSEKIKGSASPTYLAVFDGAKTIFWGKELFEKDASGTARVYAGMGAAMNGDWTIYLDPRAHGMMDLSTIENLSFVGKKSYNGVECLVVEQVRPSTGGGTSVVKTKFWVDPIKSFGTVRMQSFIVDGIEETLLRDHSYELQSRGGIWLPSRYLRIDYDSKGSRTKQITVNYNYEPNVSIDEDKFKLVLPSGTQVFDETVNGEYVIP